MDATKDHHLSGVSQKEKDEYYMISLIHEIYISAQMNLPMKQRQSHRHGEQARDCQEGPLLGGRMDWEVELADESFHI